VTAFVIAAKIEQDVFDDKDKAMLEDLIVAALSDAKKKVSEKTKESFQSITGFPLPGM